MDPLEATAAPTGYVVYTRVDDGGFDNGRYADKPRLTRPSRNRGACTAIPGHRRQRGRRELSRARTLAACRVPGGKGQRAGRQRVRPRQRPAERSAERFAGRVPHADLDGGGARPAGHFAFIGAQQRLRPRAWPAATSTASPSAPATCDCETDVIGGNTFDYPALCTAVPSPAAGYSFCSASARAVERSASVSLEEPIPAVDLILGKQRTAPHRAAVCARRMPSGPFRRSCRPSCGAIWPAAEPFSCIGQLRGGRPLGGRGGHPRRRAARSPEEVLRTTTSDGRPGRSDRGPGAGRDFARGVFRAASTASSRPSTAPTATGVERADALRARGCAGLSP